MPIQDVHVVTHPMTGEEVLIEHEYGKETRELMLVEIVNHYLKENEHCQFDNSVWIKNGLLLVENYMEIMEIGYLIKDYEKKNNRKPLQIIFLEHDI